MKRFYLSNKLKELLIFILTIISSQFSVNWLEQGLQEHLNTTISSPLGLVLLSALFCLCVLFYLFMINLLVYKQMIFKMNKLKLILIALVAITAFAGCGVHTAYVGNVNSNITQVELSQNNFKVVDKVSGKSTATYIIGIGGLSNKALIEKAKTQMLQNANLRGTSRAIVNMTTEFHISLVYPIFFQRTVTVSAHIIEFTE